MDSSTVDVNITPAFFVLIGVVAVLAIIEIWAVVRIIRQAGYSGWWFLIGFVPILNIVMFFVFAFKKFPVRRELEQLRAAQGYSGGAGGYQPPPYGGGYPGYTP